MPVRLRLALALAASLLLASATALLVGAADRAPDPSPPTPFAGGMLPPGMPTAGFRLRDQDGALVDARALRGRPVVLTFLYTSCRETCPLAAQQIRGALDLLGRDVPVVAVSVDPANDTAASARRFLLRQKVTGRMRFALGPAPALQRVWRTYGIQPQGRDVEHSAHTILIDPRGRPRVGFPTSRMTPEGLAHDLRLLGA